MINRCGCNDVTSQPIEFIIPESEYSTKLNITKHKLFEIYEDISKLKKDVICDFLCVLKQLECGIQPDLENIKYNIMKIDCNTIGLANINTFLKKERYLSEFNTEHKKELARNNLGITQIIQRLEAKIDNKEEESSDTSAYIGSGKDISDITIESNKITNYGKGSVDYNIDIINDGDYVYFIFPNNTPLIEIYIGGFPAWTEQLENITYNNITYKVSRTEPQYAGTNEVTIQYTN